MATPTQPLFSTGFAAQNDFNLPVDVPKPKQAPKQPEIPFIPVEEPDLQIEQLNTQKAQPRAQFTDPFAVVLETPPKQQK